ncbi:oligosaccharide flippase family protein, partial [Pseudomonas sp. 51_B]|uniref:oligosaccharide flippase family protein n=1 Tax=Pseudomonas sp. 51_B TaxID=2813573 RepID=UPI001FAFD36E
MFNLAMRIIDLPRSAIYNGLMSYALPVFARRSAEPARLIGVIGDSTAISGFVLTPLFFGIALTAEDIILLIFGAKWADAIPLLQVLACTAALGNLALYATTALVAVNRTHLTLKAEVATTLLALALVGDFANHPDHSGPAVLVWQQATADLQPVKAAVGPA